MVEGIVFEVKRNYVIVMTKSGEFKKLKKKGTVKDGDIYRGNTYTNLMKYYAAAAIILIVITSFTGYNAYAHQIVGYVDIKGNKTVRLYINRLGNVQKSEGLSDEDFLKNLSIYDAVEEIASHSNDGSITLQDVKFKEIKPSNLNALEVEKKVKETIIEKNASSAKEKKNGEDSKHPTNNSVPSVENKDKANDSHGSTNESKINKESKGSTQSNTSPSHINEKNIKKYQSTGNGVNNTNNSKLNEGQNSDSINNKKNINTIKGKGKNK